MGVDSTVVQIEQGMTLLDDTMTLHGTSMTLLKGR
jgi:hypothetical protein